MTYNDPHSNPQLNQYLASLKRPAFFSDNNSVFYAESNFGLFIDNTLQGVNSCIVALQFLGKFPLKYLGEDTTILNFELCRIRKNLIEERVKFISALSIKDQTAYNKEVFELVAKTANYEDQYIGKRTEAKQSYKPKYHGNNGVNRVKYTDKYTNVTRPITPPQNLLASTYEPQNLVANTVPTTSANVIEQIKNQNSQFFHNMSTNLHPGPTENYYQLFPNKSQLQAEKPSVTFAPTNEITTTAEIHTNFLNNQGSYSKICNN